MAGYRNSRSAFGRNKKKKHGKAFIIILSILACLVIVTGVLFAINYNTITLMMGKGNLKVNSLSQIKKSLSNTGKFGSATESSGAEQSQVLTSVSKDNAVTLTVTQQENGKETIDAKVDLHKMDLNGIDSDALAHGSPSAIQDAKTLADSYVGPLVDSSDETGIEAYLATNLLSQYKSNPTDVNIDHTFGSAHLTLTGNLSTGEIDIRLTK